MNEVRLGTIGSGVIVRSILDAVQRTEGIRLTAVYSQREETGRALAQDYGAEQVYTSLDEFLSGSAINTVYIATYGLSAQLGHSQAGAAQIGKVRLVMGNYSQYSSRYDKLLAGELPNIFNYRAIIQQEHFSEK